MCLVKAAKAPASGRIVEMRGVKSAPLVMRATV
jgi:hypothetical protein